MFSSRKEMVLTTFYAEIRKKFTDFNYSDFNYS